MLSWCFIALILGARFGYVLFYNFEYYLENPLEILLPFSIQNGVWKFTGITGMSYHGGLIGVLIAMWMYGRKKRLHLYTIADFMTPAIPLGYFFGRIGNFINGELVGRVTEKKIGIIFKHIDNLPRHPSQIYEAILEGILLFTILFFLQNRKIFIYKSGLISSLFLIFYSLFRFICEYFREPDPHIGLQFFNLSLGQIYSIFFFIIGIVLFLKKK